MNTYIVADGGGTKTEFLFFSEAGQMLGFAKKPGTNANFVSPGLAAEYVAEGIKTCLAAAPANTPPPQTVLLFIPGFAPAVPLLKKLLPVDVQLMDDFWNAYYGALAAPVGIVALAGTGSFAAGRANLGQLFTVGGWGPLFGDGGSGYHLGVLALQAVTRRFDQGLPGTLLTEMLLAHMQINNVIELQRAAYLPGFTRDKVAKLSFLVEDAADKGDVQAQQLFTKLAAALAEDVAVLAQRIDAPSGMRVSVTGGMLKAGHWFTDAIEETLAQKTPGLCYQAAKYSPLIGSALYLLNEQRGIDITDEKIATRLHDQYEKIG